jgi:hypothetical protein
MSASRSKLPQTRKTKTHSNPPLGGRYSRTEGAGAGPERKRHSPTPKRRTGSRK